MTRNIVGQCVAAGDETQIDRAAELPVVEPIEPPGQTRPRLARCRQNVAVLPRQLGEKILRVAADRGELLGARVALGIGRPARGERGRVIRQALEARFDQPQRRGLRRHYAPIIRAMRSRCQVASPNATSSALARFR